ncbi:hypothetical protein KDN24_06765 [Bacillus sp. Bva_UNVM-123]|uniref:hypothetical protein n=1 Tax=Bacillus sp. Bva_UNVM-123 TaxID=2829798 RepID=UPI00391F7448
MNKVILPYKIVRPLEFIRKTLGEDILYKIENLLSHYKSSTKYNDDVQLQNSINAVVNYVRESNQNRLNYYNALVDGYLFEFNTPEDKLHAYYHDLIQCENCLENNGQSGSQFRQGWQSVKRTLEILGVEIEGINC